MLGWAAIWALLWAELAERVAIAPSPLPLYLVLSEYKPKVMSAQLTWRHLGMQNSASTAGGDDPCENRS